MILLNGHSLQPREVFRAETMPMTLEERNSTATITVGPDAPALVIGDWLKDDTEPGKGIVWRVKTVVDQMETKNRTITLEHLIQSLRDDVMFGDVTPATIVGSNASTCTARQALSYILGKQSIWKLGDVEENPVNPYSFSGENLFTAAETVTSSLDGAQWEYDFGSLPFTLHVRKLPAGFASEMRMSRNITTIRRQIDRTRMYTRIYPIGKNNLKLPSQYLSRNENLYGTISKIETDEAQDTAEKLTKWAQERLNRHCEPTVTVTVTGLDLSADTGEALDHIVVGRRCRVPLPEYGTTITEKVTRMAWTDKLKEPAKVTVTLANLVENVASIVRQMAASSARRSKTGAKQGEEDHAWFVDTTEHVGMVAEAVAGEGADKDWSLVSSIMVDGKGIHQRVTSAEGTIARHQTRIEQTEKSVGMVVEVRNGKELIKAAEICAAINDAGESEAHIDAKHVYIGNENSETVINGKLDVKNLDTEIGNLDVVHVKSIQEKSPGANLSLTTVTAQTNLYVGTGQDSVELIGAGIRDAITNLQITQSGNTYTLQKKTINSHASWTDVGNFSRATTLSGAWSGDNTGDTATYTVGASPQGVSISSSVQLKLNKNAAWVNDPNGTIRARLDNPYGTCTLSGAWSGDNQGDEAIYTVTAASPHTASNSSKAKLNINQNAAWITDPDGTIRARLGNAYGTCTLSGAWSGDNQGDEATYTVTAASPHSATNSSKAKLHINASAAWITDPDGTIRARLGNSYGTCTLSGAWSGDNTGDEATYTVTAASPHSATNSSKAKLHINQNAAWITDPGGTIRARLGNSYGTCTLGGAWSGDNTGDEATYTVTAASPHSATNSSTLKLKINQYAAWVQDPDGTIRARVENPVDPTAAYNEGTQDGWDLARGEVVPATEQTTSAAFSIGIPAANYGGSSTYDFTLDLDKDYAYVKNALNHVVAQKANVSVSLSGAWSGDNTGDEATYTVTESPHGNTNASKAKLHINASAAWITDPDGTIRARLGNSYGTCTLSGAWSGDNTGDEATYTVTAASPHSATNSSKAKLHINKAAAWITDPDGTIRARVSNPADEDTAHTNGMHDGWDLARGYVDPPGESTASDSFVIGVPASNYNTASSYTFTLGVDDTYVYARNAANQVVARKANPAYTNGYQSAQALALPAWSWDGTDNWIGTNIGNQKYKISLSVFNNTVGVANADGYQISGSPAIEVSPAFVYDVENRQTKIHCTVGDDSTGLNNDWIYWLQWRSSDRKVIMCDSNGQINGSAECSVPEATVAMMIIENKNSTPSYTPYTMIDGMNNIDPGMRGIISVDGKYYAIQTKSAGTINRYKFGPYASPAAMKRAMGISDLPPLMFDSEILEAGRYYAISVTDGNSTKRYYFRTPSAS